MACATMLPKIRQLNRVPKNTNRFDFMLKTPIIEAVIPFQFLLRRNLHSGGNSGTRCNPAAGSARIWAFNPSNMASTVERTFIWSE